jgi:hypothetical protein
MIGSHLGPYEIISRLGASSPRHLVPLLRPARRPPIAAGLNFHLDQVLGFGSGHYPTVRLLPQRL